MSSNEEIERKADPDASLTAEPPEESATGDLLTNLPTPGVSTAARLSLVVLLFGGLLSVAVGATLWISRYGFEATLAFVGVFAVVLAVVLAQVYARKGWI